MNEVLEKRKISPIDPTCPEIDSSLNQLRSIVKRLKGLPKNSEIDKIILELKEYYEGDSILERLRISNRRLREWGTEMFHRLDAIDIVRRVGKTEGLFKAAVGSVPEMGNQPYVSRKISYITYGVFRIKMEEYLNNLYTVAETEPCKNEIIKISEEVGINILKS